MYDLKEKREHPNAVLPATKLFKGNVKRIKYKKGYTNADIDSHRKTAGVYVKILFRLLELMVMDVLSGNVVYFNKRTKARIYVDFRPVLFKNVLSAETLARDDIPRVDLTLTKMRTPIIAFDTGHERSFPCMLHVPKYLYVDMIERVNKGQKYSKGPKDFWFNRNK